jgi:hypothetical protein
MLFEYSEEGEVLALEFEFNPSTITRTRTVSTKKNSLPGMRGGYDFSNPQEAQRASQGATMDSESFSIKILLDATDRMDDGNTDAANVGIQPELDTIRTMLEPKSLQPQGAKTLAALGSDGEKSFPQYQTFSVLLFKWGSHILPVFMTKAQIEAQQFLPTLVPYRAEVTLDLQVIESENPFYTAEIIRQAQSAAGKMKNAPTPVPKL